MPKVPYCGRSMFYQEAGEGPVLIFLHGNTASSRLFEPLLPLYTPHFRCVLLDFLGNGRSDRVESFPADLWQEEARQALALQREEGKQARREKSRAEREAAEALRFRQRQEKRREKRRGH